MIDFDEKRIAFVVHHHIQTQNVETHISRIVLRLTTFVLMSYEWKPTYQRFDGYIFDFPFEFVDIDSLGCQLLVHAGERSLVPVSHIARIVIEDEFGTVFVDSIIGEMHELLIEV